MGTTSWSIVVIGTALVGIVILLRLATTAGRLGDDTKDPRTSRSAPYAGPLAQGFRYIYPPFRETRGRRSVPDRMARAIDRIDRVDPYAGQRRIGLAMLHGTAGSERPSARPPAGVTPTGEDESTATTDAR